jgi:hypothetical protein
LAVIAAVILDAGEDLVIVPGLAPSDLDAVRCNLMVDDDRWILVSGLAGVGQCFGTDPA